MMNNEVFQSYIGKRVDIETEDDYFNDVVINSVYGDWLVVTDKENIEMLINLFHVVNVEIQNQNNYSSEKKNKKRFWEL